MAWLAWLSWLHADCGRGLRQDGVPPDKSHVTSARTCHLLKKEKYMSLISLVIVLIVVGVLLWAANNYIPMDQKIKTIMNVVVVIAVVLWLLSAFGVLGSLDTIRVGH
jgi:uncharacterized membrane protein YidH (DUF202 family)